MAKKKNPTPPVEAEIQTVECEDCGDPIGAKRLQVLPHTTVCISCATDREQDGRFVKHRMNITSEVSRTGEHEGETLTIIRTVKDKS
jgi:RNA polymerase-binding transcription factor DksA